MLRMRQGGVVWELVGMYMAERSNEVVEE